MAKQPSDAKVNKSEYIRTALQKNPNLNLKQINEKWTRAGHDGEMSKILFYQVRRKLGIKSEWCWMIADENQ